MKNLDIHLGILRKGKGTSCEAKVKDLACRFSYRRLFFFFFFFENRLSNKQEVREMGWGGKWINDTVSEGGITH